MSFSFFIIIRRCICFFQYDIDLVILIHQQISSKKSAKNSGFIQKSIVTKIKTQSLSDLQLIILSQHKHVQIRVVLNTVSKVLTRVPIIQCLQLSFLKIDLLALSVSNGTLDDVVQITD